MITGEEWEIVDKKNWEKRLQREEIEKALDHGFYFLEANGKEAEYMLRSWGEEEEEGRKGIRYWVF